jgi:Ca2+-binding RTX toxin-like protein
MGSDVLYGGIDNDYLTGGEGNDYLYGEENEDHLYGAEGNDWLWGGYGGDVLFGNEGDDWLFGNEEADSLYGGIGNDELQGGNGADWILGGADNDNLFGQEQDDYLRGEDGRDRLEGGQGRDDLDGGAGDDVIRGGTGVDYLLGGTGADRFLMSVADIETIDLLQPVGLVQSVQCDIISDFNAAEGDKLDLDGLLLALTDFAGSTVQQAMDQGYLYVLDTGNAAYPSCTVCLDRNGNAPDNLVKGGDIAVFALASSAAEITTDCFVMNSLSSGAMHLQFAVQAQYVAAW